MDRFEDNDTAATATDLHTISGTLSETALSIEFDDLDWYRFTLPSAGRPGDTVSIEFDHELGDVDLELYGSDGTTLLDFSYGIGNLEEISLAGLAAGSYYVLVYAFGEADSPDYTLAVAVAPQATGGNDVLTGDDDANTFAGLGGDDAISGLGGIDTSVFTGVRADYAISLAGDVRQVNDMTPGRDGNDSLSSIERQRITNEQRGGGIVAETGGGEPAVEQRDEFRAKRELAVRRMPARGEDDERAFADASAEDGGMAVVEGGEGFE